MREIAIVTRGGEVMMIGGGSSGLGRLLTIDYSPFHGSFLLDTLKENRRAERKPHAAHSVRIQSPMQGGQKVISYWNFVTFLFCP